MVQKKDNTLRFCVDYQMLNSVTSKDTFPLPRIDNLLNQLIGKSLEVSMPNEVSGEYLLNNNAKQKLLL